MPPEGVAFLIFVSLVGTFGLLFPFARAAAERLRPRSDSAVKGELEGLRDDILQELHQLRGEVADLGERMDFAERLLAKQKDAERLAPPR